MTAHVYLHSDRLNPDEITGVSVHKDIFERYDYKDSQWFVIVGETRTGIYPASEIYKILFTEDDA